MTEKKKEKILVTSALPYANGDIHIGHLVEYLQTDFWVRFQKMKGNECLYMCADDTHGTPIMISARTLGITPEELIEKNHRKHINDFSDFEIRFDNYYSTNSPENKEFSEEIYSHMKANNHIETKFIKQLYCEKDEMFLPDRFVVGTCPHCGAGDQYGDSCDKCSTTYSSFELKEPRCAVCQTTPIEKESEHLFFKLNHFKDFLKNWVKGHTSKEVTNKLEEWLKDDLRDWDISRDAPYFGFTIPGQEGKYFYVWVDAPIGYISSTKNWCTRNNRDFKEFWQDPQAKLYHFIGKDIVYFHTLFWPAMLYNAGYKIPDGVFVHGFLTVNGEKMSKSKGTFIKARTYLDHMEPLYLRYYYASKLSAGLDDIDLNFDDFVTRVNAELIGKITNLASRGIQMLNKLGSVLGTLPDEGKALIRTAREKAGTIADLYENREFNKAIIEIRQLADLANRYFDQQKPWETIKLDPETTRGVLTTVVNLFRIITIFLKPVLPSYCQKVEDLLDEEPYQWDSLQVDLENHRLKPFTHLAKRLSKESVEKMIDASKETPDPGSEQAAAKTFTPEPLAGEIDFNDFMKVDLRVAKVLEAEMIKEADKLIRLKVDIGVETRTIIAGIKQAYNPTDLVGRHIVVVANLKPRKMKFGTSEGMLLAAGPGGKDIFILSPDSGATPGERVH
jgi:methionyl-tRNA synthetase